MYITRFLNKSRLYFNIYKVLHYGHIVYINLAIILYAGCSSYVEFHTCSLLYAYLIDFSLCQTISLSVIA